MNRQELEDKVSVMAQQLSLAMGELLSQGEVQRSHRLKAMMAAYSDLVNILRWVESDLQRKPST